MLFGIIARGTAFMFRHYDAVKDEMHRIYNRVFVSSSFITPFFLGVIAGSAVSGHINMKADDFLSAYILSWFNLFSISVGLFTIALCGFLAAVYLIGEADDDHDKRRFIRKAWVMNIVALMFSVLVFFAAHADNIPLIVWVFSDSVGLSAVTAAGISQILLWYLLPRGRAWLLRMLSAFQVTMILLAISYAHFPDFIILKGGGNLSLLAHQAPSKTMTALACALLLGSVFILPMLFYLFYSFQKPKMNFQEEPK
jgi:cytochrome d ubiquinol oxidase subunit II